MNGKEGYTIKRNVCQVSYCDCGMLTYMKNGRVVKVEGDWPRETGARVMWDSVPDGRGRVLETVERFVGVRLQLREVGEGTMVVLADGREVHRVLVGNFLDRASAELVRAEIDDELGVGSMVRAK